MNRVRRALVTVVALSVVASASAENEWLQLGEPLVMSKATPIRAILDDPAAFHDHDVRIEGRIASVCTQEGCFIEVVPKDGGGEGVVVNFPGLAHTFPIESTGLEAVVEGRFYQKIYPHARVNHWQHHSFRPGVEVPEYSLAFRMDASGAKIGGTRAALPEPAEIRSATANRVDLDLLDFEAEAFGIGRRTIPPGTVVPRPSTGGNRWMVVCLVGNLVVHRQDGKPVPLSTGEMSYVSAGVMFEVRNESTADADFILVYTREIEKVEKHTHPPR